MADVDEARYWYEIAIDGRDGFHTWGGVTPIRFHTVDQVINRAMQLTRNIGEDTKVMLIYSCPVVHFKKTSKG